ncbi:MAG: hypothetical protein IPK17_11475 [Chloroflexi bacterium]|uniref:hypothetical protein n=1 Tax=Candidatus Flexifilum breve TaxID=3140694 RepID=UPI00313570E4|nr:hypothetical protein [Chloroflexota bacterium]
MRKPGQARNHRTFTGESRIAWACQAQRLRGHAGISLWRLARRCSTREKEGDRRAFEVRSAQTLAENGPPPRPLSGDGVRDRWVFRTLPPDYQPNGALPAFALSVDADESRNTESAASWADLRATEIYALGAFVGDLLTGQVRWCDHAHAHTVPDCEIVVFYTHCYRCRKAVYVHSASAIRSPRVVWKSASPPTSASNSA